MKSIGEVVKEARMKRKLSRDGLEKATKIKKEFIEAIERQDWQKLPEYPVVVGFAKNIADALKIDREKVVALLRRDYPPQKVRISPKPDVAEKFVWSPKLTFFVGLVAVSIIILSYLGFQYLNFVSPPQLELTSPTEGQVVDSSQLAVTGVTDTDATIEVNNQPVLVNDDGSFATEIEIIEGTGEVVVTATSRSGKETAVRRNINPKLGE